MIEEICDSIETKIKDATNGINALIVTHNSTADFALDPVKTIDVWDLTAQPSALALPALWLEWHESPEMPLVSQSKWRGEHRLRFWYWLNASVVEKSRRHVTGMARVLRSFIDSLPGTGTIEEVSGVRAEPIGYATQKGQALVALLVQFTVSERYEGATP